MMEKKLPNRRDLPSTVFKLSEFTGTFVIELARERSIPKCKLVKSLTCKPVGSARLRQNLLS